MNNYMTCEDIICDANNLYSAYKASVRNSKWKESSQRFMLQYLNNIINLQDDLKNRTYNSGSTGEFVLTERGKIRPITSYQPRDRIVRHVLCDDVLMPRILNHIIYDNCASVKGRGLSQQNKRFEVHLRKYYQKYGNNGYILFGDFSKFFDNVIHDIAKEQLLALWNHDEYLDWLLTVIFKSFQVDVSYMSDLEFFNRFSSIFNSIEYRTIPKKLLTGEKMMEKSVNIGDQLSQMIGIYYPHPIDNYVKYVESQQFYGRYMDDWYIMSPDKTELKRLLLEIEKIANSLGLHINHRKTRIVKISKTFKFLQIKYTLTASGKIIKRANPKRVTTMRRKLKKLHNKLQNGLIEYNNIEEMFRGWMGSYKKLLSKQQRTNMIKLYEQLFNKHISIFKGKMIITEG